jgi:hypothetical protein
VRDSVTVRFLQTSLGVAEENKKNLVFHTIIRRRFGTINFITQAMAIMPAVHNLFD